MIPRRCAFIDIGTNTILCLIAELGTGDRFTVLDDLAEITRLGQGVDHTGWINPDSEEKSLAVLERFLRHCRTLGVEDIVAVGTSALREARNSAEVRARFKKQLGCDIRVISGDEEANYAFLAVQQGLPLADRELLVVDIGGGSTEFIRGNVSGVLQVLSVDLGTVRLTERFLHSDPVSTQECSGMVEFITRKLDPLRDQWLKKDTALTLVGIAGTFTTLAAVEKKLVRYSHSDVHGSPLILGAVRQQIRMFQEKSLADRKTIPGLEPKRADVILAGAYLVESIMTLFRVQGVVVSDQGVRYGLLHEHVRRFFNC